MNRTLLSTILLTPSILLASNYPAVPGPWGDSINFNYLETPDTANIPAPPKTISHTKSIKVKKPETSSIINKENALSNPLEEPLTDKKVTTVNKPQKRPVDHPVKNFETPVAIPSPQADTLSLGKTKINEQNQATLNTTRIDMATALPSSEELEQSLPAVMSSKVIPARKTEIPHTELAEQSQVKEFPDTHSRTLYTQEIQENIEPDELNNKLLQQQVYTESHSNYPAANYPRQSKEQQNPPYQQLNHSPQAYSAYPAYYGANPYYQAYPSTSNTYSQQQWGQRNYQQPFIDQAVSQPQFPASTKPNTESLYQSFDENAGYPQYIPSQSIH